MFFICLAFFENFFFAFYLSIAEWFEEKRKKNGKEKYKYE